MFNEGFSSFETAKLLGVSDTTVTRWVEEGKLKGFRTPSGRLRVSEESIRLLLQVHGRPLPKGLGGGDVLVVDDDPEVLDMLVTTLERRLRGRVTVRGCATGLEALIEVGKRLPDVAIIDVVMAHVDGWKVCEAIRGSAGGGSVRLIVITGHRNKPEFEQKARALGADYLTKPLNMTLLLERTHEHLSSSITHPAGTPQ